MRKKIFLFSYYSGKPKLDTWSPMSGSLPGEPLSRQERQQWGRSSAGCPRTAVVCPLSWRRGGEASAPSLEAPPTAAASLGPVFGTLTMQAQEKTTFNHIILYSAPCLWFRASNPNLTDMTERSSHQNTRDRDTLISLAFLTSTKPYRDVWQ